MAEDELVDARHEVRKAVDRCDAERANSPAGYVSLPSLIMLDTAVKRRSMIEKRLQKLKPEKVSQ